MENLSIHLEPLRAFLFQIGAFIPRLLVAVLIVVLGWLLAKAVRFATIRALRAVNFHVLTARAGIDTFLRQGGMVSDTSALFGVLAYWLIILASLIVAFNTLDLSYVTDLLSRVLWFVPNVFVALLILAFGAYFARFVGDAVTTYSRNAGMQDGLLLGKVAQGAILLFVVLIALDQLRVGGDIVRQSFLIILGGVVFALALAFGLAGKAWAAERIESWWPREGPRRGLAPNATASRAVAGGAVPGRADAAASEVPPSAGMTGIAPPVPPGQPSYPRPPGAPPAAWPRRSDDPQDRAHP
ncbi:mechanosensitive ion channel family protein [Variovorax sp.]|uniref:mechanosensitive ion channel family protein n=1 Tax=Variovorax sp. TaxID=1871043 RepID=UPI002D258A8F|nr:hypothetical protein [Variovorax sp.]HYP81991.1 hypothetical protein [Variovorax sp.]